MADRQGAARPTLLGRLQERSPNSSQAMGFLALVVSGSILLLLSGLTLTGLVMGLVLFAPLFLITSPIWVPMAIAVFLGAVAVLSACSFGAAAVAAATWVYRYLTGRNPMGAGRVDYARSQIADTASHVKGYAREYGGYLQSSRAKDAAPGA